LLASIVHYEYLHYYQQMSRKQCYSVFYQRKKFNCITKRALNLTGIVIYCTYKNKCLHMPFVEWRKSPSEAR
jgi:hypothetical protein